MINTFFFFIAIIDKFSNFTNFNDGHFWGVANRKDKYDKVHSLGIKKGTCVRVMVFNATFNNIEHNSP